MANNACKTVFKTSRQLGMPPAAVFADASVAQAVRHMVGPANEQNPDRLAALLGATRAGSAA